MIIKIIPLPTFTKQLDEAVVAIGSQAVNKMVGLHFEEIGTDIGNYLAQVFNDTEIAKSLRGGGGEDLVAHFGLTDQLGSSLADGMANIIKNSVVVGFNTTDYRGTIIIRAIEKDWEEYKSLPGASYISQPSNITIPVIEWLLMDPSIDIGAAEYQIVFSGDKNFYPQNSRSGRAIMVELKSLGGGGGYLLPDIISKTGGANFIEMAIGQAGVAQKCAELVIKRIK